MSSGCLRAGGIVKAEGGMNRGYSGGSGTQEVLFLDGGAGDM